MTRLKPDKALKRLSKQWKTHLIMEKVTKTPRIGEEIHIPPSFVSADTLQCVIHLYVQYITNTTNNKRIINHQKGIKVKANKPHHTVSMIKSRLSYNNESHQ